MALQLTKLQRAILSALTLIAASGVVGCAPGAAVRDDWEASLHGSLNLECRNIEHLGYGLHYDIVMNSRQAMPREFSGAPARTARSMNGGQRGE